MPTQPGNGVFSDSETLVKDTHVDIMLNRTQTSSSSGRRALSVRCQKAYARAMRR